MAMLERCDIQPSVEATSAAELILPLVHFDIAFLFFHPIQRLLFFEFPCSKHQFIETVVPKLKESLAQSLDHFLPLAGNIVAPLDSGRPFSRFVAGDSVSFTIAESDKDFDVLTGNHPRAAADFYDCVPELPRAKRFEKEVVFSAIALQVTLFPGRGLCMGFANDHGIGDASSIVQFIKLWASVNRFGYDARTIGEELLPVLDRTTVEDPEGLDSINWNEVRKSRPIDSPAISIPVNKFRSTFILRNYDVQRLKDHVHKTRPGVHVTTFTVTCALAWVCLLKAENAAAAAAMADDEAEYFAFPADCRGRLRPPLPATYFGNCLALVKAESTYGSLKGDGGFVAAAELLGEGIKKTLNKPKGILDGAETWLEEFRKLVGKRLFGVAGSPRFDLYDVDYGWGQPTKFESASIDADTSMSLCKSRDSNGGVEIGLSRPKEVLDAFAAVFAETLEKLNIAGKN